MSPEGIIALPIIVIFSFLIATHKQSEGEEEKRSPSTAEQLLVEANSKLAQANQLLQDGKK